MILYKELKVNMKICKSWIRDVRVWISDTLSPAELIVGIILFVGGIALIVVAYITVTQP